MHISIVHSTKNRIRIKAKAGLSDLEVRLADIEGVLFTSMNKQCGSMVIRFDDTVISHDKVSGLLFSAQEEVENAA